MMVNSGGFVKAQHSKQSSSTKFGFSQMHWQQRCQQHRLIDNHRYL
jgi:hypothetical protein